MCQMLLYEHSQVTHTKTNQPIFDLHNKLKFETSWGQPAPHQQIVMMPTPMNLTILPFLSSFASISNQENPLSSTQRPRNSEFKHLPPHSRRDILCPPFFLHQSRLPRLHHRAPQQLASTHYCLSKHKTLLHPLPLALLHGLPPRCTESMDIQ